MHSPESINPIEKSEPDQEKISSSFEAKDGKQEELEGQKIEEMKKSADLESEEAILKTRIKIFEAEKQRAFEDVYQRRETITWEEQRQLINKLSKMSPLVGSESEIGETIRDIEGWKRKQEEKEEFKNKGEAENERTEENPEIVPEIKEEIKKPVEKPLNEISSQVEQNRQKLERQKEEARLARIERIRKEREEDKKRMENRRKS